MKLIKFNDYNQNLLRSKQILIFKCFFLIDFSIRSLKKLYEEPERFKLWDPSVQKTKLQCNMSGNRSKIYTKILKRQENLSFPESQQLLISYSSDFSPKGSYFMIEQSVDLFKNKETDKVPILGVPLNFIVAKQKPFNKTEIKQYLCIDYSCINNTHHNSSFFGALIGCRHICRRRMDKKAVENAFLKLVKAHFDGMKNYVAVIDGSQEVLKNRQIEKERKMSISNADERLSNKAQDPKNKYQENQDFLSKLLQGQSGPTEQTKRVTPRSKDNKTSNVQKIFAGQDVVPDIQIGQRLYKNGDQFSPQYLIRSGSSTIIVRDELPRSEERIQRRKESNPQQKQDANKIYRDLGPINTEYANQIDYQEYSDSSPRNNFNPRSLREQARDLLRETPSQTFFNSHLRGSNSPPPHMNYSPFTNMLQNQLQNNEERGLLHYQKSGVLLRKFEESQYQRKPSPVTERRAQMFRQKHLQRLKTDQTKRPQDQQVQPIQSNTAENSIEELLQKSFEGGGFEQQELDSKQPNKQINMIRLGISADKDSSGIHESSGDSNDFNKQDEYTSEDSQYDLEEETKEVELGQGHINTFFEDNDFRKDPKHGLIFTNEALMRKQRGVMTHFIKQMGYNVLNGKSILNVSLPIKVFDSKSFLEKIAMFMKMAPVFFEKASEVQQGTFSGALKRFKLMVAYFVSIRHYTAQMRKPFNPILGETFEARVGDYKICLEQISHHPPISYFHFWSKRHQKFRAYGSLEYRPVMGANSAGGHAFGPFKVEFEDGGLIEMWSPKTEISGLLYGERAFNIYDKMVVKDKKNGLFCEIVFNPDRKSGLKGLLGFGSSYSNGLNDDKRVDYIEGVISTVQDIDYKHKRGKLRQGEDFISLVHGHWTEDLYIDGVRYWHIDDHKGFAIRPVKNPLPSDSRFREDLVHLINTDEETGQKWKEILEDRQRNDKKLREDCEKRRKRLARK